MKKLLTAVALLSVLTPSVSLAQTTQDAYNNTLRQLISLLIQEVTQLQAQLVALQAQEATITPITMTTPANTDPIPQDSPVLGVASPALVPFETLINGGGAVQDGADVVFTYTSQYHLDSFTITINGEDYPMTLEYNRNDNTTARLTVSITDAGLQPGKDYFTLNVQGKNEYAVSDPWWGYFVTIQ